MMHTNRATRATTVAKDKPTAALPFGSNDDNDNKKQSREHLDRVDAHVGNFDDLLFRLKQLIDDGNSKLEERIESSSNALCNEISTLRKEVHQLKAEYAQDFDQLSERHAKTEIDVRKNKDSISRMPRSSELILTGVPFYKTENTSSLLRKVSSVLEYHDTDGPLVYTKRLARFPIADGANPPILLQFAFKAARDDFFHRYFLKKGLNLNQLGFDVDKRVYLNENLTDSARNIKGVALKLKRSGKVRNVFSKDGTIFVKPNDGNAPVQPIFHVDQLKDVVFNT